MRVSSSFCAPFRAIFVCFFSLLASWWLWVPVSWAEEKVFVWCYYNTPPFTIDRDQGLNFDIVSLMNETAKGLFSFEYLPASRVRVDLLLSGGETGIVLFVSPIWIKEQGKARFVWSGVVLHDRNEVLSRKDKPVEYTGAESVYGLTLGGVCGHNYKGLTEAIAQGKIIRSDASSMEVNVRAVIEGRGVDFTTIPKTVLGYLLHKYDYENVAYISRTPLTEYTRHLLLNNPTPQLEKYVLDFVAGLPNNPKWQTIKAKYKLQ